MPKSSRSEDFGIDARRNPLLDAGHPPGGGGSAFTHQLQHKCSPSSRDDDLNTFRIKYKFE